MVAWWCSKANKIWLRVLALVVSSVFFFTQVVGASVPDRSFWADRRKARQKLLASKEKPQQSDKRKGLGKKLEEKDVAGEVSSLITPQNLFTVPSQYGTVKEVHTQGSSNKTEGIGDRLIIHIQDAHSSPEAQLNSANILKYFQKGIAGESNLPLLICIEGSSGFVDTTLLATFPRNEIREKVARSFLKEGRITGEEYFAIVKGKKAPVAIIYGVEDKRTYEKNLKAFDEGLSSGDTVRNHLQKVREEISPLKARLYNKRLKELESKIEAYQKKRISLTQYSQYLYGFSQGNVGATLRGRPTAKYPNFELFVEASKIEKNIDFSRVDSERSEYIKELSKKLTNDELSNLLVMSLDYRLGKVTSAEYYTHLQSLSSKMGKGIRSQDPRILTELVTSREGKNEYPNLNLYIKYNKLYDRIDQNRLFSEISELEQELKERLCETEEERELVRLSRMLGVLQDLVSLKISNEDLAYYYKHRNEITKIGGLSHFFENVAAERSSATGVVAGFSLREGDNGRKLKLATTGISPANLSKFEEFYKIALKRNQALVDNTICRMEKLGVKVAVLIAGGFHTPGITELLREKNMSYVVVTPRLGENDSSDAQTSPRKKRTDFEKAIVGIIGALRPASLLVEGPSLNISATIHYYFRSLIADSKFAPAEAEEKLTYLKEWWREEHTDFAEFFRKKLQIAIYRAKSREVIEKVDFLSVLLTNGKKAFALGVVKGTGETSLPFVLKYDAEEGEVSEIIYGEEGCRDFFLSGAFDNTVEAEDALVVLDKLPKLWPSLLTETEIMTVIFGKAQPEAKNTVLESLENSDQEEIMERQEPIPSSSYTVMPWVFLGGFFDGISQFTHNAVDVVTKQVSSIASHLPGGGLPLETTLSDKSEVARQLASLSPHHFILILIAGFIIFGPIVYFAIQRKGKIVEFKGAKVNFKGLVNRSIEKVKSGLTKSRTYPIVDGIKMQLTSLKARLISPAFRKLAVDAAESIILSLILARYLNIFMTGSRAVKETPPVMQQAGLFNWWTVAIISGVSIFGLILGIISREKKKKAPLKRKPEGPLARTKKARKPEVLPGKPPPMRVGPTPLSREKIQAIQADLENEIVGIRKFLKEAAIEAVKKVRQGEKIDDVTEEFEKKWRYCLDDFTELKTELGKMIGQDKADKILFNRQAIFDQLSPEGLSPKDILTKIIKYLKATEPEIVPAPEEKPVSVERPAPAPEKPVKEEAPKGKEEAKPGEEKIVPLSNEQEAERELNRMLGELENQKQALIKIARTEAKRAKIEEALKAYLSEWDRQKSHIKDVLGKIKSSEKQNKYSNRRDQVDGEKVKEEVGKIIKDREEETKRKKMGRGPLDNAVSILLSIAISVIILPFLINVAKAGIRGIGRVSPDASLWDRILSTSLYYQYYNYIRAVVIVVGVIVLIWYAFDFYRSFRAWREKDPERRKLISQLEFAIIHHLLFAKYVAKYALVSFLTLVTLARIRRVVVIKDRKQLDSILDSPFYYLDNNVYFIPDGRVIYRGPEGSCKWEGPVLWSHGKVLRGKEYLAGWRTSKVIKYLKKKYGIERKPFVVACKRPHPQYSYIDSKDGVLSVVQLAEGKYGINKFARRDTSILKTDLSADNKELTMLELEYLLTELQNYSGSREEVLSSPPYRAIQEWKEKNLPEDAQVNVDMRREKDMRLIIFVRVNGRMLMQLHSREVAAKIKETGFHVFGDRINPSKQKELQDAIVARDAKKIKDYARKQIKGGARWLDIGAANIPDRGPDEECEDLAWVVEIVQSVTNTPIILDSAHPPAIEAALRVCRPDIPVMINSINEKNSESILSILKKYKNRIVSVIVMALPGLYTCEEKLESIQKVLSRLEGIINPEDIYIDPAVVPLQIANESYEPIRPAIGILETIKNIKTLPEFKGMKTTAGFRNASYELPNRHLIDRTFVSMAIALGADSGMLDSMGKGAKELMDTISATRIILKHRERLIPIMRKTGRLPTDEDLKDLVNELKHGTKKYRLKLIERTLIPISMVLIALRVTKDGYAVEGKWQPKGIDERDKELMQSLRASRAILGLDDFCAEYAKAEKARISSEKKLLRNKITRLLKWLLKLLRSRLMIGILAVIFSIFGSHAVTLTQGIPIQQTPIVSIQEGKYLHVTRENIESIKKSYDIIWPTFDEITRADMEKHNMDLFINNSGGYCISKNLGRFHIVKAVKEGKPCYLMVPGSTLNDESAKPSAARREKARPSPPEKKRNMIMNEINRDVHSILRPAKCKRNDIERALELLDGSLDFEPENPYTLCNYAFAYIKLSHFEPQSECLKKALSYAEKCLQVRPKFLRGYFLTAWIICRQGDYARAFAINAQGLEKDPDDRDLLHQRIKMLVDVKRYKEALPLCERHLRVHPYDLPVYNFLWICQHKLGMSEEAEKTCRTAVQMGEDPRRKRVWSNRLKRNAAEKESSGSTSPGDTGLSAGKSAKKAQANYIQVARDFVNGLRFNALSSRFHTVLERWSSEVLKDATFDLNPTSVEMIKKDLKTKEDLTSLLVDSLLLRDEIRKVLEPARNDVRGLTLFFETPKIAFTGHPKAPLIGSVQANEKEDRDRFLLSDSDFNPFGLARVLLVHTANIELFKTGGIVPALNRASLGHEIAHCGQCHDLSMRQRVEAGSWNVIFGTEPEWGTNPYYEGVNFDLIQTDTVPRHAVIENLHELMSDFVTFRTAPAEEVIKHIDFIAKIALKSPLSNTGHTLWCANAIARAQSFGREHFTSENAPDVIAMENHILQYDSDEFIRFVGLFTEFYSKLKIIRLQDYMDRLGSDDEAVRENIVGRLTYRVNEHDEYEFMPNEASGNSVIVHDWKVTSFEDERAGNTALENLRDHPPAQIGDIDIDTESIEEINVEGIGNAVHLPSKDKGTEIVAIPHPQKHMIMFHTLRKRDIPDGEEPDRIKESALEGAHNILNECEALTKTNSQARGTTGSTLVSLLTFFAVLLSPALVGFKGQLNPLSIGIWGVLVAYLFFRAFPGISNWILEKLGINELVNRLRRSKVRPHPVAAGALLAATFTYSTIRMLQIFPASYKLSPVTSVVTFGVFAVILTIILYGVFPPSTKTNLILLGNNGQGVFSILNQGQLSDTKDLVDRGGTVSLREIWRFMKGMRGTMPYAYIEWEIAKDDIPVQITTKEHIVGRYFLNEEETVEKIRSHLPPIEKCRPGRKAKIGSVQFVTKFRIGMALRPQLVWTFKKGDVKKLARVRKLNLKLRPTGYPVVTDGTYRGEKLILVAQPYLGCFIDRQETIVNKLNKKIQRIIKKKNRKKVCTIGKGKNAFKVIRVVSKKVNLVWAFYEKDIEKVAEYFGLTLRGEAKIPVFKKGKGIILLTKGGGLEEYYGGISCHRAERVAKLARKRFPDPKKYQAKDESSPHEYTLKYAEEPFTLRRYRIGPYYRWGVHEDEVESCMSYLGATFIAHKITKDYIPITAPSLKERVIESKDIIWKRLRVKNIPFVRAYDKPWFDLDGVRLHKSLSRTAGMAWAIRVEDFKAFCKVVGLTPPILIRPRLYRVWPSLPEGMGWSDFALENYERELEKFAKLRGVLDIEKLKKTIKRKVTDVLISDLIYIETRRFRKVKEDYDRKLSEILDFLRKELMKLYRRRRGDIFYSIDQTLYQYVSTIFHGIGGWVAGVEYLLGRDFQSDVEERTIRRKNAVRKKILEELRNLRIYINKVQSLAELSQYAHIYALILEIFPEAEKEGETIWPEIKDFLTYQEKKKQVATFREAEIEKDEPGPDSEFTDTELFYNRILEIFPEDDRSVLDSEVTDRQLFDFVKTIMSIARLTKRGNEIVDLHYLQGIRVVEIAEMLEITRSDVYSHRSNALRKLRKTAERLLKEGKESPKIQPKTTSEQTSALVKEDGNEDLIDFAYFHAGKYCSIPIIRNKKCHKRGRFYKMALNGGSHKGHKFKGIIPIFEDIMDEVGLLGEYVRGDIEIRVLDFDRDPKTTVNVLYMKDGRKVIVINKAFVRMIAFQLMNGYQNIILKDEKTDRYSDLVTSEVYSIAIHELRSHIKLDLEERKAQHQRGVKYGNINVAAIIYYWSMNLEKFDLLSEGQSDWYRIRSFILDNPHLLPDTYSPYYLDQLEKIEARRIRMNIPRPDPSDYYYGLIVYRSTKDEEDKEVFASFPEEFRKYVMEHTDYDKDRRRYYRLKKAAHKVVGDEGSPQPDEKSEEDMAEEEIPIINEIEVLLSSEDTEENRRQSQNTSLDPRYKGILGISLLTWKDIIKSLVGLYKIKGFEWEFDNEYAELKKYLLYIKSEKWTESVEASERFLGQIRSYQNKLQERSNFLTDEFAPNYCQPGTRLTHHVTNLTSQITIVKGYLKKIDEGVEICQNLYGNIQLTYTYIPGVAKLIDLLTIHCEEQGRHRFARVKGKKAKFYLGIAQEAREFIKKHKQEFWDKDLHITSCVGHAFEVERRLKRQGIECDAFFEVYFWKGEIFVHVWVETKDGYIIDACPDCGKLGGAVKPPRVLKRVKVKEDEYRGNKIASKTLTKEFSGSRNEIVEKLDKHLPGYRKKWNQLAEELEKADKEKANSGDGYFFPLRIPAEGEYGDFVSFRWLPGMEGDCDVIDSSHASDATMHAMAKLKNTLGEGLYNWGEDKVVGLDEIRVEGRILPPGEPGDEDVLAEFFSNRDSKVLEINLRLADYPKSFQKMVILHDISHADLDVWTLGTIPEELAEVFSIFTHICVTLKDENMKGLSEIIQTLEEIVEKHTTENNEAFLLLHQVIFCKFYMGDLNLTNESDLKDMLGLILDYVGTHLYPDSILLSQDSDTLYESMVNIENAIARNSPVLVGNSQIGNFILNNLRTLILGHPDYAWRLLSKMLSKHGIGRSEWCDNVTGIPLIEIERADDSTNEGKQIIKNCSRFLDSIKLPGIFLYIDDVPQTVIDRINSVLHITPRTEQPAELSLKSGVCLVSANHPMWENMTEPVRRNIIEAKRFHGKIHGAQQACKSEINDAVCRLREKEMREGQPVSILLSSLPEGQNSFTTRIAALRALLYPTAASDFYDVSVLREAMAVLAEQEYLVTEQPDQVNKGLLEDLLTALGMERIGTDTPTMIGYRHTIDEVRTLQFHTSEIIRKNLPIPSGVLDSMASAYPLAFVWLPEVLGLGVMHEVGKTVVEIGRRFIAVIRNRPSERTARWSFAREEGIFAGFLLSLGFLDPSHIVWFYLVSSILSGISHTSRFHWQEDGTLKEIKLITLKDKIIWKTIFTLYGFSFRWGYLIPGIGPILGPIIAFGFHAFWNNAITRYIRFLPLGMATSVKKEDEKVGRAKKYISYLLNDEFFKSLLQFFKKDPKDIFEGKGLIRTIRPYSGPKIIQAMIVGEMGFDGEHILIDKYMEHFRHNAKKWACVENELMIWERAGIVCNIDLNKKVGHDLDSEEFKAVSFTYINQEGKKTRQKILYSAEGIPDKEAENEGWYKYMQGHDVHIFFCEDWSAATHGYDIIKPALNKICYVLLDKKNKRPELTFVKHFRYSSKYRPLYLFGPNMKPGRRQTVDEGRQPVRSSGKENMSRFVMVKEMPVPEIEVPEHWDRGIKQLYKGFDYGRLKFIALVSDEKRANQAMSALETMILNEKTLPDIREQAEIAIAEVAREKPKRIRESTIATLEAILRRKASDPAFIDADDNDLCMIPVIGALDAIFSIVSEIPNIIRPSTLSSIELMLMEGGVESKPTVYQNGLDAILKITEKRIDLIQKSTLEILKKVFLTEGLTPLCYRFSRFAIEEINITDPARIIADPIANLVISLPEAIASHSLAHYQIYLSKPFEELTNHLPEVDRYSIALSAYRLLRRYDIELDDENIRKAINIIINGREEVSDNEIFALWRKVINIAHSEDKFKLEDMEDLEYAADMDAESINSFKGKGCKKDILDKIEETKGELTVWFHCHGAREHIELDKNEFITVVELGNALINRRDLSNVVLIVDACYSYDFCVNLLNYLEDNRVASLPIIISSNNLRRTSNLKLIEGLKEIQKEDGGIIKMQDIFNAECLVINKQDFGVFVPINPGKIRDMFCIKSVNQPAQVEVDYIKIPSRMIEVGLDGVATESEFHDGQGGQGDVNQEQVETLLSQIEPFIEILHIPRNKTEKVLTFRINKDIYKITVRIDNSIDDLFKLSGDHTEITINPDRVKDTFGPEGNVQVLTKAIAIHEIADALGKQLGYNHNTRHTASLTLEGLLAATSEDVKNALMPLWKKRPFAYGAGDNAGTEAVSNEILRGGIPGIGLSDLKDAFDNIWQILGNVWQTIKSRFFLTGKNLSQKTLEWYLHNKKFDSEKKKTQSIWGEKLRVGLFEFFICKITNRGLFGKLPFKLDCCRYIETVYATYEGYLGVNCLYHEIIEKRRQLVEKKLLDDSLPMRILDLGCGKGNAILSLAALIVQEENPDLIKRLCAKKPEITKDHYIVKAIVEHLKDRYQFVGVDILEHYFVHDFLGKASIDHVGKAIYDALVEASVIQIEHCPIEDLPEEWSGKFHYVVSVQAFRYLVDRLCAWEELYRVLAYGGEARIDTSFSPNLGLGTSDKEIPIEEIASAAKKKGFTMEVKSDSSHKTQFIHLCKDSLQQPQLIFAYQLAGLREYRPFTPDPVPYWWKNVAVDFTPEAKIGQQSEERKPSKANPKGPSRPTCISIILAGIILALLGFSAYFLPEIGAPGNGAELAGLGGFMWMLLFGGLAVDVGVGMMGVFVGYRVIGWEEMIESLRNLVKEFYSRVCIAKEYLVNVAFVRLPEVLALGIARKVEKPVVEIGRRFIAVIVHRPSERTEMEKRWVPVLRQKLSEKEITGIMALVKELNERRETARLSGDQSAYQENTEINPLEWTPLVREREGSVRGIEKFVKEIERSYERINVIGEETIRAIAAGEINPEETLFVVSSPGREYEYVRAKLTEFYRSQGIPAGEIESKVAGHFRWIGKTSTAFGEKAGKMKPPRRFNRAEGLLVLLALRGVNIESFLKGIEQGMAMCKEKKPDNNPGAQLLILQEVMKKAGRNRVFLVLPEELKGFCRAWRELISLLGREGEGIIPILEGELASPESYGKSYGKNTAFIHVNVGATFMAPENEGSMNRTPTVGLLKKAGYPVFEIPLGSEKDIAALFYSSKFASDASYLMAMNRFTKVSGVETLSPDGAADSGIATAQPLSKHGVKPEAGKGMGTNLFVVHVENLLKIKSVRKGTPFMMKMELEVTPGSRSVLEVMKRIIDAEKEGNLKKAGFVFVSNTRDVRTEVIKRMLTNFMIGAGLSPEVVVRAIDSNLIIDERELRKAGGIIRISGTPKISTRAVLSIINERLEGRPDMEATGIRIITDKKNNWRNDVTKEMMGEVLWMVPESAREGKGLSTEEGVAVAIEGKVPEWLRRLIDSIYNPEEAKRLLDQIERERTIILRAAPVVDEERLKEFEAQKWIYEIQA